MPIARQGFVHPIGDVQPKRWNCIDGAPADCTALALSAGSGAFGAGGTEAAVARILSLLVALTLFGFHVPPAWPSSPRDDLRASVEDLLSIVEDRAVTAEQRAVRARSAVRSVFDFASAAPRALGPHWRRLSASQREETTRVLSGLLTEAVVARISQAPRRFAGRMRERIAYGGESVSGDRATVRLTLLRGREDVPVVADMVRRGKSWRVDDLWLDGISVVDNYRAQFERLIRDGTYDDVIGRLQARWDTLSVAAVAQRET
jgi:phospholipid transport system substrate-binding protein